MSKYVIELDDTVKAVQKIAVTDCGRIYTHQWEVEDLEELTADYVNEHFGILQDDAYNAGFENGKKEAESSEAIEQAKADAFNKGMLFKEEKIHDAFLRGVEKGKAVNDKGCEGCKYAEMGSDTTICAECCNAYHNQWTAKDDKIEVGDEVRRKSASENERGGIVTKDWENSYFIMWTDGSSGQWDKDKVVKTGRHFNIDKILEEMKA